MKRFYAGAALAGLAASTLALAVPAPALAETPAATPADLAVGIKARQLVVDSNGKTFFLEVQNKGGTTAKNVKVVIDLGQLGPDVVADLPGTSCTGDRAAYVCELGDLEPGYLDGNLGVNLRPASPDAPLGRAGKLTATISSDYHEDIEHKGDNSTTYSVDLAAPGIDYGVLAGNLTGLAPDTDTELWIAVDNNGSQTGSGLSLSLTLPEHVVFSQEVQGCSYTQMRAAVCEWSSYLDSDGAEQPIVLDAGSSFDTLVFGLKVRATPSAPANTNLGAATVTVGAFGEYKPARVPSELTGDTKVSKAKVTGKQVDRDKVDNSARFTLTTGAANADLAVTAAGITGAAGQTVKTTAEITNHGPWDSPAGGALAFLKPEGTELVSGPVTLPAIPAGGKATLEFSVKILSAGTKAGSVTVTGAHPDSQQANNSAEVGLKVTPAPVVPTPSASPSATATATPAVSPSAVPVRESEAPVANPGTTLPVTGTQIMAIAAAGAVALAGGVLLVTAARRRRSVHTRLPE
ncbi:LPXTG cell wall anchor domain-containing protein [Longispora albida]|uniref:LPXTG cell wall anchor domain-containing protein n=1 Tax=Longispora albida TaxID=203523 RepID=UPI00036B5920|nr:LPXTG cell wall anchor domain-containing protein [Longispora albida]